ncbi:flagellar hook-basal body complex protein, partial [Mycobacterium tuberculosis]
VTANNIANVNTTGFKQSRAEFADLFSATSYGLSKNAVGSGVRLTNVAQQFSQGNNEQTGRSLDMAISGEGF